MLQMKRQNALKSHNARGPRAGVSFGTMLTCRKVFEEFKTASGGGADAGPAGVNGSANPASSARILQELGASDGKAGVDLGAADGKFMLAAAASGSGHVTGFELPENEVHKILFDAVVKRINRKYDLLLPVQWIGQDIDEVNALVNLLNHSGVLPW